MMDFEKGKYILTKRSDKMNYSLHFMLMLAFDRKDYVCELDIQEYNIHFQ